MSASITVLGQIAEALEVEPGVFVARSANRHIQRTGRALTLKCRTRKQAADLYEVVSAVYILPEENDYDVTCLHAYRGSGSQ